MSAMASIGMGSAAPSAPGSSSLRAKPADGAPVFSLLSEETVANVEPVTSGVDPLSGVAVNKPTAPAPIATELSSLEPLDDTDVLDVMAAIGRAQGRSVQESVPHPADLDAPVLPVGSEPLLVNIDVPLNPPLAAPITASVRASQAIAPAAQAASAAPAQLPASQASEKAITALEINRPQFEAFKAPPGLRLQNPAGLAAQPERAEAEVLESVEFSTPIISADSKLWMREQQAVLIRQSLAPMSLAGTDLQPGGIALNGDAQPDIAMERFNQLIDSSGATSKFSDLLGKGSNSLPNMSDARWSGAMTHQIKSMIDSGNLRAELQMTPPDLGELRIKIELSGTEARVWVHSASADARAALEQAIPRLQNLLDSGGLNLSQANVSDGKSQHGHHNAGGGVQAEIIDEPPQALKVRVGLVDDYA